MVTFEALVGCHDILILGKSPIKWRQRPDMTLAVDWDVNQFKQTKKNQWNYWFVDFVFYVSLNTSSHMETGPQDKVSPERLETTRIERNEPTIPVLV